MRAITLILCILLSASSAHADFLTDMERQEMIEKLAKIREATEERVDARFRAAIRAYRQAMTSNEAVIDFYLQCVEKVKFKDQLKDRGDFREWKDKQEDLFSEPSFKLALRYQLQWLILTLQAASKNADQAVMAKEASSFVDTIFSDISKVDTQSQTLKQSAISSVFAKAYEIGSVDTEWPGSPVAIAGIYESIILPPLRTPSRVAFLRSAWLKRIKLEELNATAWINKRTEFYNKGRRDREKEREAKEELRDEQTLNQDEFDTDILPNLIWKMEVDLFKSGDETGSASRMIAHITKNYTHKSATKWAEELQGLLSPELEETETPAP